MIKKPIGTNEDLAPKIIDDILQQRPRNISEVRKLQLVVFSGIEKPLDAEQWLIKAANFIRAV